MSVLIDPPPPRKVFVPIDPPPPPDLDKLFNENIIFKEIKGAKTTANLLQMVKKCMVGEKVLSLLNKKRVDTKAFLRSYRRVQKEFESDNSADFDEIEEEGEDDDEVKGSYIQQLFEKGFITFQKSGFESDQKSNPSSFNVKYLPRLRYDEVVDFMRSPLNMINENNGMLITDAKDACFAESACAFGKKCYCFENFGFVCRQFIQRKTSHDNFDHSNGIDVVKFSTCLMCLRDRTKRKYESLKLFGTDTPFIVQPHSYVVKNVITYDYDKDIVLSTKLRDVLKSSCGFGKYGEKLEKELKTLFSFVFAKKPYQSYSSLDMIYQKENEPFFGIIKNFPNQKVGRYFKVNGRKRIYCFVNEEIKLREVRYVGVEEHEECFFSEGC
jgi:hypothetical protein